MSSAELQTAKPARLATFLAKEEAHDRIAALVSDFMDADGFIALMLTAFQDPDIQKCDDVSKFEAVHKCAAMGLLPTFDHVKLIPYGNKCTVMPQWQGFKAIVERHPAILEITPHLVHNLDTFAFINGVVEHQYDPFDPKRVVKDIADVRGGYTVIYYRDGRPPKYHFTPAAYIVKARACAKTRKVWDAWTEQMCLKTCIRDCYHRRAVPVDPIMQQRLAAVTRADDAILENDPRRIGGKRRQTVPLGELTGEVIDQQVDDSHDGIDEPAPEEPTRDDIADKSAAQRTEYENTLGTIDTAPGCDAWSKQAEVDFSMTDEDREATVKQCREKAKGLRAKGKKSNGEKDLLSDR